MYGKHHTKEARKKQSDGHRGKPGPQMTNDGLRKLRIKRIKEISDSKFNGHQIMPSFNKKSCEFFKQLNEALNINGMFATNGGEYHIKELGYFLDYYEPSLNLVVEWDEKNHYDIDGNLKNSDRIRETEIINHLKCKFIRIKESNFNQELTIKHIYENITNKH